MCIHSLSIMGNADMDIRVKRFAALPALVVSVFAIAQDESIDMPEHVVGDAAYPFETRDLRVEVAGTLATVPHRVHGAFRPMIFSSALNDFPHA